MSVSPPSSPSSPSSGGTVAPGWRRYVALGDSFTEGMSDPAAAGVEHPWRGWADRLADALGARATAARKPFDYANLAVRGRLLPQIVDEQLGPALQLRPDLVSIVGGGNDVLRPGVDVDAVTELLDDAVRRLRASGATVLMATAYDPRLSPLVRRTRGLAGTFTASVWSVARRHDAHVLDLWGMRALQDRRMWAEDRIHLNAEGHRRVALQALEVLGVTGPGEQDWSTPLRPEPARPRQQAWADDALWVRTHVVPWVGRRLRGRSSGDGLPPKRPEPAPVTPVAPVPPAGRGG